LAASTTSFGQSKTVEEGGRANTRPPPTIAAWLLSRRCDAELQIARAPRRT